MAVRLAMTILGETPRRETIMKVRPTLTSLAAIAAIVSLSAVVTAGAAPGRASLTIRHQVRGCHAWSLNGNAFKARQSLVLRRGGSLTVTNNDVMPHALIKVSGLAVRFVNMQTGTMGAGMGMAGKAAPGTMNHMGASTKVFFAQAGVYRFTTKAGEDYMKGMKTIGEDKVLRLTVTVS
jgi:hypothetical protein